MSTALTDIQRDADIQHSEQPVIPLAVELGLYVDVPVVVPGSPMSAKTNYSSQSEENSD